MAIRSLCPYAKICQLGIHNPSALFKVNVEHYTGIYSNLTRVGTLPFYVISIQPGAHPCRTYGEPQRYTNNLMPFHQVAPANGSFLSVLEWLQYHGGTGCAAIISVEDLASGHLLKPLKSSHKKSLSWRITCRAAPRPRVIRRTGHWFKEFRTPSVRRKSHSPLIVPRRVTRSCELKTGPGYDDPRGQTLKP